VCGLEHGIGNSDECSTQCLTQRQGPWVSLTSVSCRAAPAVLFPLALGSVVACRCCSIARLPAAHRGRWILLPPAKMKSVVEVQPGWCEKSEATDVCRIGYSAEGVRMSKAPCKPSSARLVLASPDMLTHSPLRKLSASLRDATS
jgi:hypothetical protein